MKTKDLRIIGSWKDVMNAARFTVGKKPLDKEPSYKFKLEMLIAEHSPIRVMNISWIWENMPHWVGVHWVRHKWEKFVRTQRSDRTGIPREKLPQDEPQDFMGVANPQSLIDTMRKRLCYKASPETREYAEDLRDKLFEIGERELSMVCVPNCVYRGGCPEQIGCGLYEDFTRYIEECGDSLYCLMDIGKRYALYDEYITVQRVRNR